MQERLLSWPLSVQVGKPEAAQSLGKQLMTTGFSIGIFNSVLAGVCPCPCLSHCFLCTACTLPHI